MAVKVVGQIITSVQVSVRSLMLTLILLLTRPSIVQWNTSNQIYIKSNLKMFYYCFSQTVNNESILHFHSKHFPLPVDWVRRHIDHHVSSQMSMIAIFSAQGRHWAMNCFTSLISSSLLECIIPWNKIVIIKMLLHVPDSAPCMI